MAKSKKSTDFEDLKKEDQIEYFEQYREALYDYYVNTFSVKETTSYEAIMINREIAKVERWIKLMKMVN